MSLGDDDRTPTQGVDAALLQETLKEMLEACPDLAGPQAPAILMEAARRASEIIGKLEKRIVDAGTISSETAVRFMVQGAVAKILSDMGVGEDRRKLYEAGVRVGAYIAKRWQKRIERELSKRDANN